MTRDELIALAKEADAAHDHVVVTPFLERFAALVAAKEREACAALMDARAKRDEASYNDEDAETHRACAAAIRARKP